MQYLLPKEMIVEAAYVGNKGTRMWGFNQMDVVPSTNLALGDTLLEPVSAHPQYSPYVGFPTSQTVAQAMLPYPQYNSVTNYYAYNVGSNYSALQVTVTKHLTSGLGFLAAYTWSKTMGYQDSNGATGYGVPQDAFNRGLERSVASFNYPQNLKLTWSYDLPIGKGKRFDFHLANYIIGGWQLAGIHNYISGAPIIVGSSGLTTPAGFGSIRPDVLSSDVSNGDVPKNTDVSVPVQWLNPAAFANVPTSGNGVPLRVGTAPRTMGYLRGPATLSESFRMSKAFPFYHEKAKFKVGMTMTDPFKRTSSYLVDGTVGDSAFGEMLRNGAGRTMQLDARIDF